MSKISVALCTYNGAEFLSEQLESFLKQTRLPDELIVADDCSRDETARIVGDFARRASFPVDLRINRRNVGSTENFRRAVARCRGDIIFLSDQDDVWLPEKIEKTLAEFAAAPDVGLVFTDAEIVDERLAPLNAKLSDLTFSAEIRRALRKQSFFEFLILRNYITGATLAFRARYRERFAPFPTDIPEMIHDAWIAFVILAAADFRFIDEPLVKYRQHAGQQLGIFVKNRADETNRRARYTREIELAERTRTRIERILREVRARPAAFAAKKDLIETIGRREIERLTRRVRHHEARRALPAARFNRLAPVARELFSGRYREISKGFLSAAKDLFGDV